MSSILIKNADYLVTMDNKRRVLRNASLYCEGKEIIEVDTERKVADKIIDASGMIVLPGFINTHLHIPQVFHRHCPAQQNKPIEQWIKVTTAINRELCREAAYYGALICFAELILSGVTTTSDYFYPFPRGKTGLIEATIQAAHDIGIRFTSIRGSMSLSKKQGTLYDEDVVEGSQEIIKKSQELIEKYHDNSKYSMIRIGLGPCLPWSSTEEDYRLAVKLAKKYPGVILQTHVSESLWEFNLIKKRYSLTPVEFMGKLGFVGPNVSFVHCNFLGENDLEIIKKTKTNIVVCPICNTRDATDGNGIAPLTKMSKVKINLSLGTDGAASNDSLNILSEMRYFRTVSVAKEGLFYYRNANQASFSYFPPSKVFDLVTLGGAKTLNRDDIGSLEKGKAADIVIFNPSRELNFAGVLNKWGALTSCQAIKPYYLIINGKVIVEKEEFKNISLRRIIKEFQKFHQKVIIQAQKKISFSLYDYPVWEKFCGG